MSTSKMKTTAEVVPLRQINKPVEQRLVWDDPNVRTGGPESWTIGDLAEAEIADFNRNPDGFAAAFFGLTLAEYYEWSRTEWNVPLCSARTVRGKLCGNPVAAWYLPCDPGATTAAEEAHARYWRNHHAFWIIERAMQWKRLHRKSVCAIHRRGANMRGG